MATTVSGPPCSGTLTTCCTGTLGVGSTPRSKYTMPLGDTDGRGTPRNSPTPVASVRIRSPDVDEITSMSKFFHTTNSGGIGYEGALVVGCFWPLAKGVPGVLSDGTTRAANTITIRPPNTANAIRLR